MSMTSTERPCIAWRSLPILSSNSARSNPWSSFFKRHLLLRLMAILGEAACCAQPLHRDSECKHRECDGEKDDGDRGNARTDLLPDIVPHTDRQRVGPR